MEPISDSLFLNYICYLRAMFIQELISSIDIHIIHLATKVHLTWASVFFSEKGYIIGNGIALDVYYFIVRHFFLKVQSWYLRQQKKMNK